MMTAGIIHTENPDQENLVCMRPVKVSGQISSDQTGQFHRVSSRADRSVMVLYAYNSNNILTGLLKNNTTSELVRAYLLDRGLKPTALRIDNEFPEVLKRFSRSNIIDFQLCPTKNHRANQAEKAINTKSATSWQASVRQTPISPCISGAASSPRPHKP